MVRLVYGEVFIMGWRQDQHTLKCGQILINHIFGCCVS